MKNNYETASWANKDWFIQRVATERLATDRYQTVIELEANDRSWCRLELIYDEEEQADLRCELECLADAMVEEARVEVKIGDTDHVQLLGSNNSIDFFKACWQIYETKVAPAS